MPDTRRTLSALQTLLADNGAGDISAQDARDELISSHPEKVITTAVQASRPSSDLLTGDIFLPSNGSYIQRYNGSAWAAWGPISPMTIPVDGDFSWVNQGTATVSATTGPIVLAQSANSGSFNYRLRVKTIPSAPYTVTIGFRCQIWKAANAQHHYGFVLRNSGSGNIVTFYYRNQNESESSLQANNWANATGTFNSSVFGPTTFDLGHAPMLWLRLVDDNTNRKYLISTDGISFRELFSESRTAFITPDQIGICMATDVGGAPWEMTLLSWKEE